MRSKNILYNIGSNLLLQLIVVIYGFIVPRIIINYFGSSVNGLIVSITQFLAYITLLESGLGPVIKSVLYKPIANRDKTAIAKILKTSDRFFRIIAYVFLLYMVALCFLFPTFVSNEFDTVFTISLILIIGISTFAEYFFGMTYKLYLQSDQKTYVISIIQIITYILSIIIIIILVGVGASIHIIKLASGIVFMLRPIIQRMYVKSKYGINFNNIDGNYELKQKWDGLVQHIAFVIHNNTDITILTLFVNLTEISVYSVYYLVVKGVDSLIQSFSNGIDATFGDMIAKNEKESLNKSFSMYEVLYYSITTIAFTCTIILIVPFVTVYTKGVTDANYIRNVFGPLIVISEYIWAIRLPYSSITLAAGHFKQTKIGAWIECFVNIFISILLVKKYGLIGVTIGTIVAMSIRTIEFVYHANKYILDRSIFETIKKVLVIIFETLLIVFICKYLPYLDNINYFSWFINATITFCVASFITLLLNFVVFNNEFLGILSIIKKLVKRTP